MRPGWRCTEDRNMSAVPDYVIVLPEIVLGLWAMAALLVAVYTGKDKLAVALTWATVGLFVALALWIGLGTSGERAAFGGMFIDDPFARFAKVTILVSAAAIMAISQDYMSRYGLLRFEFPVLVALSVLGMLM